MTQIESDVDYYGFVDTEFVQWDLTTGGHLEIRTLEKTNIYIAKDKWSHKRTLLGRLLGGPGKIEFKIAHNGHVYIFTLTMNPIRERPANEELFCAGRNGPLNLSSRPFTAVFGRGQAVDPDNVLAEL